MVRHAIPSLRPTLEEVRDQFENWRKTRQRRKALRPNHTALKNRVQASNSAQNPPLEFGQAFLGTFWGLRRAILVYYKRRPS